MICVTLDRECNTLQGAVNPINCAEMVFVATPIRQTAVFAGATSGTGNITEAIAFDVIGALNRLLVLETGKSAAVPVPQFEPVPV